MISPFLISRLTVPSWKVKEEGEKRKEKRSLAFLVPLGPFLFVLILTFHSLCFA
jgi:hypothetical protein